MKGDINNRFPDLRLYQQRQGSRERSTVMETDCRKLQGAVIFIEATVTHQYHLFFEMNDPTFGRKGIRDI